jgi:ketosteroid isomerase-like protein
MSEENVEIVRAASQAWNAGDMDAFREMHDPDVILRPEMDWPEPGPYTGREAVMGFYRQLRETWDADTLELTGDVSHAADRVVARWVWHARGTDLSRIWK